MITHPNLRSLLALAAVSLFILQACNFSKGVKKDLNTGLTASYNGASLEDIYLADGSEKRLNSNKVSLGNQVTVLATGVQNFTVENGNVYPGCEIVLTDKNKKELLNLPDAFADQANGLPAAEANVLKGILNTGSPMAVGETYHLKVKFFDKKKPTTEILADVDIQMTE